jgi:hypothetical protein
VNDFVSRLIARSSGGKSSVRPTIAPAFAPEVGRPRRSPAGEILQNLPGHTPAIAPLPFETFRQKETQNLVQPPTNLQSPKTDSQALPQLATLRDHARRIESREGREARQVRKQNQTLLETDAVSPISSLAMRPEIHDREFADLPTASLVEPQSPSTIAVAREVKSARENEPSEPIVPATPLQPPVFAARPSPERNTDLSVENARKKKASEPVVQVTIGKIEVRASIASAKPAEKKTLSGAMSLEEYQRVRNRRSAG